MTRNFGPLTSSSAEHLAQRFRPYLKFSVEDDEQEPHHPVSWEDFVSGSSLILGGKVLKEASELSQNPAMILSLPDGDMRTTNNKSCPYEFVPGTSVIRGDSWKNVKKTGAGIYAQVEETEYDFVVITYWFLFGENSMTFPADTFGDHYGDIAAVCLLYDGGLDKIVRVDFVIHGEVLEQFDISNPTSVVPYPIPGKDINDDTGTEIDAIRLGVKPDDAYQNGPWWHDPSRREVFFACDPETQRPEHLILFIEWGSHELWPNPMGGVYSAPNHEGTGISFLPDKVRFLGSVQSPELAEAPFFFFNGMWGNDPKGLLYHRSCFNREFYGPIADDDSVDRDPKTGYLGWPPNRLQLPVEIQVTWRCLGRGDAETTLRWGYPSKSWNTFIAGVTARPGDSQAQVATFSNPHRLSELEVQTEGGYPTGYFIDIKVANGDSWENIIPAIRLVHNWPGEANAYIQFGPIGALFTGMPNDRGELRILVNMQEFGNGPILEAPF